MTVPLGEYLKVFVIGLNKILSDLSGFVHSLESDTVEKDMDILLRGSDTSHHFMLLFFFGARLAQPSSLKSAFAVPSSNLAVATR